MSQVSGVRIDTKFSLKEFIVGLMAVVVGTATLMYIIGIIIALGILGIFGSFKTLLVIQSTAGAAFSVQVIKADKNKAMEFVNNINNTLAERT